MKRSRMPLASTVSSYPWEKEGEETNFHMLERTTEEEEDRVQLSFQHWGEPEEGYISTRRLLKFMFPKSS